MSKFDGVPESAIDEIQDISELSLSFEVEEQSIDIHDRLLKIL